MAKVSKHKARTDIYRQGLRTKNEDNKSGYSIDRSKPANESDTVLISKGEYYYTWTLYRSPKQFSRTYPRRQQLTNSGFLCSVYDIEDSLNSLDVSSFSDASELSEAIEDIKSQAEDLMEETQSSLDNMPDQLQYSPTGELLQERVDALESFISDLENVDTDDYEEPEDDDLLEDFDGEEDEKEEWLEDKRREHFEEWAQEKMDEVSGLTIDV